MANDQDMYDNYDQNPAGENPRSPGEDTTDKEDTGYQSFLAPKASFPDDLKVGDTHEVKVERILDNEVEMSCTGGGQDEEQTEPSDNPQEEQAEDMYS